MNANEQMPLSFVDYQRIYQVIFSVITAARGLPHRACMFFAGSGALLLQDQYKLNATISAGLAAYKLNAGSPLYFGRAERGQLVADVRSFHAWVEVEGYAIDFTAPLFDDVAREEGMAAVPRRMFQKPLAATKDDLHAIAEPGDFLLQHDEAVASDVIRRFGLDPGHDYLVEVCQAWFTKPPRAIRPKEVPGPGGNPLSLQLRAPAIEGAW
jgi:hypothetical protein